ncbi:MAG: PEP-CTERM sorting domain-containing protein [Isosphaeraceae bacterium]
MSAVKTVAWGVVVWGVIASPLRADSISSGGGSWVYFFGSSGTTAYRASGSSGFFSTRPTTSVPVLKPFVAPSPSAEPVAPVVSTPTTVSQAPVPASFASRAASSAAATVTNAPAPTSGSTPDAFINLGSGPYAEASSLTVGNPQPWYTSPSVTKFFNGAIPDSQQQSDFSTKVLNTVQQTFAQANLYPKLTLDPNAGAFHTMSVVSGANYGPNPNAIGITDVGHSGFGFIDKLSYADSIDELATAVGKNVSHELMHAFGVGNHPDSTGAFVDAGTASWEMLTDPNSTFSPDAVQAINATQFSRYYGDPATRGQMLEGEQEIAAPVPEPTTWLMWGLGLTGLAVVRRSRARRLAA